MKRSNTRYNTLPLAKEILNGFSKRYAKEVGDCSSDIRPDWNENGLPGCSYEGIEEKDQRIIYDAIATLGPELQSSLFDFDVANNFITPEKAVAFLQERYEIINSELDELKQLKQKYSLKGTFPYQIRTTLDYHQKTVDVLEQVMKLDEIQDILNPGYVENLESENLQLKFDIFWRKQKSKYILQILFFFIFLLLVVLVLIYKNHYWVGILAGLITIANSFISKTPIIESFKAFLGKKIKKKNYEEFIKK